ncbi:AsmA-like C-terminal region-containing protein [Ferruginibacter paludis]|uniref:AsmA-like C-terminal region-containing protein n=1 Tax=Ferruginibacter paludis TaxID=1310417 RepID=UPI0025B417E5|nr:AsmA-like C-terminal region-containing protein [Ferruginibacter paludis]MDN3659480.1 AsmA-like C-terminal region-containing protein [Ferruginibacter paludis]
MVKKIIKIVLISLVVLIVAAFAAPYLFKSQIVNLVKKEINKKINAKVDFKDVDISFFRHFPKVAVGLDELRVIGTGVFAADTLVSAQRIDAALNIMSVVQGKDMTIYSVFVESPRVHAIVNKDSLVNWDIMKPDTAVATLTNEKPFKMALQQYALSNAYISYRDETAAIGTEIFNLNHKGSGDFTSDLFTLKTTTNADAVTVTYGGIPYISNARAVADADIQVDNKSNVYRFKTDKITVNDLKITGEGAIKNMAEKGYDLDIKFNAPSTDFKNILSLIPAIYKNDFNKIKTSGSAIFSGFVKGVYSETAMPGYHVDMEVKDGFFQYPDLPKPLQQINIKAQVDNPDGVTDNTVVNVEKAHIEMDKEPFDIRLLVKKPISNLFVDAAAKGKLDLGKIAQLIKLEAGTKITGLLNADIYVKGNVKDIEQQKLDQFTAGGALDLNNFLYVAKDYPTGVKINALSTSFTPAKVDIKTLDGQYLSSNFSGSGQINNLLNYMLQSKPLNASLTLKADNINLNDWMGTSTDTTTKGPAAAPFAVPANLNVLVNTSIDKLHYDKVDITGLSGSLKINDETVTIADVKGNALDGAVMVNGSYSTKVSKTKPDISLVYNVDKVDVQKTFAAFNTVQVLMPIGKFIAGRLTSQLTLKGKLGDNMMPDLMSLSGNGNLLLIEGFLSKFAPLEKIASTLNVKELEQIAVKDVKNYIEFSNGQVLVKPFTVKVNGIDMEIGGLQGFDQSLNYAINMKLPRALMGDKGNQLVNNLVMQINSKGIPVKVGETVNLNLKLGGFLKSPTIKTDLKQGAENLADELKQQVTAFAKAKIDSTKQAITSAVKDTITSVKKQAIALAKDELAKQVFGNKSTTTDSAKATARPQESVKGLMNNLFKKKPKDTIGKH